MLFGSSGASIAPTMNRRAFVTCLGAVLAAPIDGDSDAHFSPSRASDEDE